MSRRAFTLVELLVVISIIGLLSSIAVVSLNSARVKARDAKRTADVLQIQKAMELYYAVNGQYPSSGGAPAPDVDWNVSNDSSSWSALQTQLAPYMAKLPVDPKQSASGFAVTPGVYSYGYHSQYYGCPLQWYMIVYQLEAADGRPDPGITACDGTTFRYGGTGSSTAIKTVGNRAR